MTGKFSRIPKALRIALIAAGILLSVLIYSYFETYWLKVKEYEVVSNDIPPGFDGFTIVFVSDIHHGPYYSLARVEKLAEEINELRPDAIILGGDYVYRGTEYIIPVFRELSVLRPPNGVYAALGNHDHWEDAGLTRRCIRQSGFFLCENNCRQLHKGNDSIAVSAVGDLWEGEPRLEDALRGVPQHGFCIFITHNPDFLESLNDSRIDLTLSGHTHGGQITLFGLWAPVVPSDYGQKYRYGLTRKGSTASIITSGTGTISPPLRLFCRPEIVKITLKSLKAGN